MRWLLAVLLLAGMAPAFRAVPQDAPSSPGPDPAASAPEPQPEPSAPPPLPAPPTVKSRKGFSIRITNPVRDDFRFGRSDIEAEVTAADPSLVQKVEFFVDDRLVFIDTEPPYRCVFDFGREPRSWVIRAVAYHREGVTVSDSVILRRVVLNYAVQVNRVVLYASAYAKGDGHHPALDLKKEDLLLEEDGARQTILDFYLEKRPVTLAVILDSSGSMQPAMEKVHAAASRFVSTLGEQDRGLVIDFDDKVFLLQDLTADRDLLQKAISSTSALGGTALYDALYASYRRLKGIDGRKAIVLLTDGEDNESKFSFKRVLDQAKISDVIIYAIGLGTTVLDVDLRRVLKTLSEETGGRAYFPGKLEDLEGVYEEIAAELKSQYYLTYEPNNTNWDGRWRKIKLSVPEQSVEIRTRSGYYAVRKEIK
ncbi:MAG TPA: VWA domain-containing protein [Candidatus Polarisedimenticolia bacterium]|nr:VWA domain-containing protein [Candidatus Polarisedimenticolia bacterium]